MKFRPKISFMATTWAAKGRRILGWVAAVVCVLFLAAAVASYYFSRKSPVSRDWVVQTIESRYQCEVELEGFHVSYFPLLSIEGEGLILRRKEQPGLPPLASIRKFSAHANWLGLLNEPRHFGEVRMEGLALCIPPHSTASQAKPSTAMSTPAAKPQFSSFVLDEVLADDATLTILSANPAKPPHLFAIHKLRMQAAGIGQPMSFQVTLTNPQPVGEIRSKGQFGPWNVAEPSLTPVSGSYSFSNADLGTIRGLGGKLSSRGLYQGVLNQIQVQGETDTPDSRGERQQGAPVDPVQRRSGWGDGGYAARARNGAIAGVEDCSARQGG